MKLLIIGFIYILLSCLYRKKYNAYWGLLFVLFIMGLQSNVSGDYYSYMEDFYKVSNYSADHSQIRAEIGWYYLMKILSPILNYEMFIFLLSLMEYLILARFINRYLSTPYKFVSGLLFFFYMNMMLFQMKGLRQGFAIELIVASFLLIDSRKILWGGIMALLALSMHTSSLVIIPLLALFCVTRRYDFWKGDSHLKPRVLPVFITLLYVSMVVNKILLSESLRPMLMFLDLNGYEGYFGEMESNDQHILIYIYGGILVYAVSYYLGFAQGSMKFMAILTIIGQFLGDFLLGMGSLFRLALYYSIFSIIIIPEVANFLYTKKCKTLSLLFVFLCVVYAWRTFMPWVYRVVDDGFYTYKFVFE